MTHHANRCPKLQVQNTTMIQPSDAVLSSQTSVTSLSSLLATPSTSTMREELQLSDDSFADMTEAEFAELDALVIPSKWPLNIND